MDPLEPTVMIEQNLSSVRMEAACTALPTTSACFTLRHFLAGATNTNGGNVDIYVPAANNSAPYNPTTTGQVAHEQVVRGCVVGSIRYSASIQGPMTESWNFQGKDYRKLTTATHTWGSFDSSSVPGAVRARDIILSFNGTSGSDYQFRIQSFTINIDFRVQVVREIGNTNLAGYMYGVPKATFEFDLLEADLAGLYPERYFAQYNSGVLDFNQIVTTAPSAYVQVFSPTATRLAYGTTESNTPIKSFKLESMRLTRGSFRSAVNAQATKSYSADIDFAVTPSTGGVLIYPGAPA